MSSVYGYVLWFITNLTGFSNLKWKITTSFKRPNKAGSTQFFVNISLKFWDLKLLISQQLYRAMEGIRLYCRNDYNKLLNTVKLLFDIFIFIAITWKFRVGNGSVFPATAHQQALLSGAVQWMANATASPISEESNAINARPVITNILNVYVSSTCFFIFYYLREHTLLPL